MTVISVLCPTRERPGQLRDTITGLLDLATDPGRVEILVAADADDPLPAGLPAQVVRFPQRHGYAHLEVYYNTLAALAKGDWLFIWNDDATMTTHGWDRHVRDSPPGFLWAPPCNPQAEAWMPSEFPVVPAAWFAHLGHFSLHHSVDMWLGRIGLATDTGIRIPVRIIHEVAYDRDTSSYPSFHTAQMEDARQADITKLRELLG